MESDASTTSSSSGDVATRAVKPMAELVASYFLRSMDWKSKRVETEAKDQDIVKNTEYSGSNDVERQGPHKKTTVEVEAEPDASIAVEDEIPEERTETTEDKKEFEVTYQCLPDVEEQAETEAVGGLTGRLAMQYLDVLLQTDEHGVGLNVGVERVEEGQVLVVQSFRRLSEKDVGPAEACGKIRVGDIVHAVDGEEVCSLQQLHTKLVGRLGQRRKFVLLRFLRPLRGDSDASATSIFDRRNRAVDVNEPNWSEVEALLHGNPQVAALVRQLATSNKLLQDQLVASRLKQEEQSIQLDQLHALYARTQAEGLPLFSLSIRPFSRKADSTVNDGVEKFIPNKIQTELIEAVNAEYARLRQEFQLQHMLDKRAMESKYAEKAQEVEEATTKKVEMLEQGFRQALMHYAADTHCSCHCGASTAPDYPDQTGESTPSARQEVSIAEMGVDSPMDQSENLELLARIERQLRVHPVSDNTSVKDVDVFVDDWAPPSAQTSHELWTLVLDVVFAPLWLRIRAAELLNVCCDMGESDSDDIMRINTQETHKLRAIVSSTCQALEELNATDAKQAEQLFTWFGFLERVLLATHSDVCVQVFQNSMYAGMLTKMLRLLSSCSTKVFAATTVCLGLFHDHEKKCGRSVLVGEVLRDMKDGREHLSGALLHVINSCGCPCPTERAVHLWNALQLFGDILADETASARILHDCIIWSCWNVF
ncbi:hypothetical protein PC119_g4116 [Phytophthora cactorum]|nr:hypothetical protein PC111_g3363 [Phytophthora cactorum]KAG3014181.1 hypothetical protein PC120_g12865 [Phytophthora cactorum]KAG3036850.1 hypothetical protein PC119_g4116 [Phytophthora cactorum]KAG3098673.1 hypothetical protein PC122_g3924 [Phytophthora cactorum]